MEKLSKKILIVEDEPSLRLALQDALQAEGCQVDVAENGHDGYELYRAENHDIVLTDMIMPGLDGLQLTEKIKDINPDTIVFAFTAFGNVDTAVKAMKIGAEDFIPKPFKIVDLIEKIKKSVKRIENKKKGLNTSNTGDDQFGLGNLVGKSKQMLKLYELIETIAISDANILIKGESGTGKELVASAIHFNSKRREQPFIKVSCASLTETLLESELFGYEKGAFTGAMQRKIGRFEQAHNGTLFLDEIGDVSETVQVKLLRVLQEREFERVGGTETIQVDVRIVSATLHDIERLVESGRFREDLYYRINTVNVNLPILSEREGDIRLLAEHFRQIHSERTGQRVEGFSEDAVAILDGYNWPGNVRELKNVVERAVLLSHDNIIDVNDLPSSLRQYADQNKRSSPLNEVKSVDINQFLPLENAMHHAEESHIRSALKLTGFNRTKAASILGISRKTLWEKMRFHRIEKE